MRILSVIILIGLMVTGCGRPVKRKSSAPRNATEVPLQYAQGFAISHVNGKTKVVVYNPWEKGQILARFTLVKQHPQQREIQVPLDSVAVFSSTELDALQKLDLVGKVTGISEARFISSPQVLKALKAGKIKEMAGGGHYYVETILQQQPQAIFYSPFQGNTGLPAVLSSLRAIPYLDYTETNPLGRAEWIKFAGLFFGKEKEADSIFRQIEKKYLSLLKMTDTLKDRPTLFSGKFFNGQWYVPGGRSYMAQIFRDAGADYLWKKDTHVASFPLSFESVFEKAKAADFWRITGTFGKKPSYREIADENMLYTHFKAFRKHHIIYCDPQKTAYFERSAMAPQWLLADFIKALHPQLLPGYQPVFYHILP
jgi:iron complex transport system substrate-binding protein